MLNLAGERDNLEILKSWAMLLIIDSSLLVIVSCQKLGLEAQVLLRVFGRVFGCVGLELFISYYD